MYSLVSQMPRKASTAASSSIRPLTLLGVNGFTLVLEGDKFSMNPGP